jgi:hypothetical protein
VRRTSSVGQKTAAARADVESHRPGSGRPRARRGSHGEHDNTTGEAPARFKADVAEEAAALGVVPPRVGDEVGHGRPDELVLRRSAVADPVGAERAVGTDAEVAGGNHVVEVEEGLSEAPIAPDALGHLEDRGRRDPHPEGASADVPREVEVLHERLRTFVSEAAGLCVEPEPRAERVRDLGIAG